MAFLTDRKRAQGAGSGREGTHHHWQMIASSIALVFIVPVFVLMIGGGLGESHDEVTEYFSRPFPAIFTGLSLVVLMLHLMREAQAAIEDYMHGIAQKLTLIAAEAFSYAVIAAGLFALAKIAL